MQRIEKLQKLLQKFQVDALIIDQPIDLYYLTGQQLSLGRLIVSESSSLLFVDGRYFEACKKKAPLEVRLTAGYGAESEFGKWWLFQNKKVGFDADYTTYAEFEALLKLQAELIPLKNPLKTLREIKEPSEITLLKRAAELGSRGYDYLVSFLQEGVTEKEAAVALELFWLKEGGDKLAFAPHIAFGEGSSQPHYHISNRPLRRGDTVLIDIGVVLDHYHSDMTRVLFFGEPSDEMREIYQIVLEASKRALSLCRPGVKIADVDHAARGWIEEKGFKQYFTHGLGHGVGLQIHESPRIHSIGQDAMRPLQEGMVITIEPGIYLPEVGGVRLEDTLVITKTGYENLTNRPLSKDLPFLPG